MIFDDTLVTINELAIKVPEDKEPLSDWTVQKAIKKIIEIKTDGAQEQVSKFLSQDYDPQKFFPLLTQIEYERKGKIHTISKGQIKTRALGLQERLWVEFPQLKQGDIVTVEINIFSNDKSYEKGFSDRYFFNAPVPTKQKRVCIRTTNEDIPLSYVFDRKREHMIHHTPTDLNLGGIVDCKTSHTINLEKNEPQKVLGAFDGPVLYVSTWDTWDQLALELRNGLQDRFEGDMIPDDVSDLVASIQSHSKEEQIKTIYNWLQNNIETTPSILYLEKGWALNSPLEIYMASVGSNSDKAMLFIALLDQIGVTAYPAFINDRSQIDANVEFVVPNQFNQVLVYIEDTNQFINPGDAFVEYPYLPSKDQNRQAIILKEKTIAKARTPQKPQIYDFDQVSTGKITSQIDTNQSCSILATIAEEHQLVGSRRSDWMNIEKQYRENISEIQKYLKSDQHIISGTLMSYTQKDSLENPNILSLTTKTQQSIPQECDKSSEIKKPYMPLFLNFPHIEDFIPENPRKYPYAWQDQALKQHREYSIQVPSQFEIKSVSRNIKYSRSGIIDYRADIEVQDNKTVQVKEQLHIMKPVLNPKEFSDIRVEIAQKSYQILGSIDLKAVK
ncbi:MAG: hypothetical protein KDD52_06975 [Bdellovibrionales bacterium]|nr:hypothetical protein [Bdellovibrionales bacterium]